MSNYNFPDESFGAFKSRKPSLDEILNRIVQLREETKYWYSQLKLVDAAYGEKAKAMSHSLTAGLLQSNSKEIASEITQQLIEDGIIEDGKGRYPMRFKLFLDTLATFLIDKNSKAVFELSDLPEGFAGKDYIAGLEYFKVRFSLNGEGGTIRTFIDTLKDHFRQQGWFEF